MVRSAWLAALGLSALSACTMRPSVPSQDSGPRRGVETNITHRQDGTVLINGHPFFPFGFYHVSWAARGTIEQRKKDVEKMGAAGFNVVSPDLINDRDVNQFSSFLNFAQDNGMYVITGMADALIPLLNHQPALLGIVLADDANVNTTPDEIRQREERVKKLAPNKLTYISLFSGPDKPETPYFGISDLVGNQNYPIGGADIAEVYGVMRSAVSNALANNSVPIANLQTFGYQGKSPPTPQELDNMTYQALMAGIKGVVYYSFRSDTVDLNKQPRTWSSLQQLAREIRTLAPVLTDSVRTELSDGKDQRPLVVSFSGPSGKYLMALNSSRDEKRLVNIALPGDKVRLRAVFGTRAKLNVQNGTVQGTLAPLEVAVYQL